MWIKRATKKDGEPYYKLMLIYVHDVLHIAEHPEEDSSVAWSLSSYDYLMNAVQQVKDELIKKDLTLKQFGTGLRPYSACYRPEIDVTPVLDEERTNRLEQLIGILWWAIELGRIDILTEVSCLSQHLAEPREGHLVAVYKIFKYLSLRLKNSKGRIVFNGKSMFIDYATFNDFNREEWLDFYHDAREEFTIRIPEPLGNPVHVLAYVDANHAENMKTSRSHSEILIYINQAPII